MKPVSLQYFSPQEKERFFKENLKRLGKHERITTGVCLECGKELHSDQWTLEGISSIENPEICFHPILTPNNK